MKKYLSGSIFTFAGLFLFLLLSKQYDATSLFGNAICGMDTQSLIIFGFALFILGLGIVSFSMIYDFTCYLLDIKKKSKK